MQDITKKVEVLLEKPRIVRMVTEIGDNCVREIGMFSYRIMDEIMDNAIYIHGVTHKRRHFQQQDLE